MNRQVDVVIVGGGVAGSALGGSLATAGLDVAIVEREAVFRDRVRGEGIHPWGVAEINRLGLMPQLRTAGANELPIWQTYEDRAPTAPYYWADDSIDGLPEIGVSHPALQESLLTWAASQGAEVIRPATAVRLDGDATVVLQANGVEQSRTGKLIVGADGRRSRVARWIGANIVQDPVHHQFGGALFDHVNLDPSHAHEARFPGGRTFILPQGEGRARVYLVVSAERLAALDQPRTPPGFIRSIAGYFPEGVFNQAVAVGPIAFFPNADLWADRIVADSVVLIGDAAGANDPSVGQGLSIAFRDVRELRDRLLASEKWSMAIRDYASQRARYFGVVRQHARWIGTLTTEEGEAADEVRNKVSRAREIDPSAAGFALIFGKGPDGLEVDDSARSRFFGLADV